MGLKCATKSEKSLGEKKVNELMALLGVSEYAVLSILLLGLKLVLFPAIAGVTIFVGLKFRGIHIRGVFNDAAPRDRLYFVCCLLVSGSFIVGCIALSG